jgi:hypothetical protein
MSRDFPDIAQLIYNGEADIIILFPFSFRQSNQCFIGRYDMGILSGRSFLEKES